MKITRQLHWILFLLLTLSCARQTAPTGGPKDTIPPTIISALPKSGTTNVTSKQVELTFDEFVALNNPKDQIIITPDVEKKYEISARKKKVVIDFENDLKANTTYSINFRDGVQDITEKNSAENLKIAFSTGTYIDSLSISGNVADALTHKPIKDATIALYEQDTFNIFRHRPVYIGKTNEKGNFKIEYLKNGNFFIYAFDDRNKNLITDSRSESYGFSKTNIQLDQHIANIKINMVRLDSRPLKLTSARPSNTYFNIRFPKGISSYRLTTSNDSIYSILTPDNSNIKVYNTIANADSIAMKLTAQDSVQNSIDTTLYAKFITRETTKEKFSVAVAELIASEQKSTIKAQLNFNKPLKKINYDSITFSLDSLTIIRFDSTNIQINNQTGILLIEKALPKNFFKPKEQPAPEQVAPQPRPATPQPRNQQPRTTPPKQNSRPRPAPENNMRFGKGFLISVENDSSATLDQSVKPIRPEDSSIILVNITTSEPNYIVQLVNREFKVLQQFINQPRVRFDDLPAGDYQIRLVIDRDQNKAWSPGSFATKTEPEPIVYYQNEKKVPLVNLKANWELGPLLITF